MSGESPTSESDSTPLSLTDIEDVATPKSEVRSGLAEPTEYTLIYLREEDTPEYTGYPTEIGTIQDCDYQDLRPLAEEGYTHYGFFSEEDGTPTLIVQDSDGTTWQAFTNSPQKPEVAHLVTIEE